MSQTSTIACPQSDQKEEVDRRVQLVGACLLIASLVYVLVSAALLPHSMHPGEAIDVFTAGAVPGLLVTLLLWLVRPSIFDQRLRQLLLGVTLTASATVALLPYVVVGL